MKLYACKYNDSVSHFSSS